MREQGVSKNVKFFRDLGLYAVGNIGSKLVTFLLVPFYTFFITNPAEFGYYDVCLTVVFGLAPFISLQFHEGGFRFLLDSEEMPRRQAIVSFLVRTLLINSLLIICIGMTVAHFADVRYLAYILAFGIAQTFIDSWIQIVRGLGQVKTYISASIFNSLAIALFSVLTVAILNMGIPGIFIANIIARIMTLGFIEIKTGVIRHFVRFRMISRKISHELMHYSLPLLPMILFWWVLNSNGVFFIQRYLGLEENGIYAILSKITGILYVLAMIFYQTWQQNAIEQYDSPDRDSFFSSVFNNYFYLLCLLVSVFPFALRMNYFWLVSPEYASSAVYLFANSVFMMGFSISSFFELGYQCSKTTSRILPGVLLATAINIGGNYLFVPVYGIYGLISVNIATYIILIIYRAIDTRKYMRIRFMKHNYLSLASVVAAGIAYHISHSIIFDFLSILAISAIFVVIMPANMKDKVIRCLR